MAACAMPPASISFPATASKNSPAIWPRGWRNRCRRRAAVAGDDPDPAADPAPLAAGLAGAEPGHRCQPALPDAVRVHLGTAARRSARVARNVALGRRAPALAAVRAARRRRATGRSEERRVGKDVSVRVELGGRRILKTTTSADHKHTITQ